MNRAIPSLSTALLLCISLLSSCTGREPAPGSPTTPSAVAPSPETEEPLQPEEPDGGKRWVDEPGGTSLRSGPSADAEAVAGLAYGSLVEELGRTAGRGRIDGRNGFWLRARAGRAEGWVFSAFLAWEEPPPLERLIVGAWVPCYDPGEYRSESGSRGSSFNESSGDVCFSFRVDGSYRGGNFHYGEQGRWSLDGHRLSRSGTMTAEGDEASSDLSVQVDIAWIDADHFALSPVRTGGKDFVHPSTEWYVRDGTEAVIFFARGDLPGTGTEGVRRWLDRGGDPDEPLLQRNRPLHYAVLRGDQEMASLLLESGPDPNARNAYGRTPLHVLSSLGAGRTEQASASVISLACLLRAAGADPGVRDGDGLTALELAAARR